ncbi:hypothetical protein [Varibaculum prostatecancerukia]|uniref:hypothetical protein n=1 Tax=Varibaculum prostatecancerukia TaxID=2811781 RepID=UPI001C002F84|nr:hypothetical protein [Varibaculum prostatecancerukia]
MIPRKFSALLRWISAQDPINTLVISCESLPAITVGKKDAHLYWQGCLGESFSADLAAQLVASDIETLQIIGCSQCERSLEEKLLAARTRLGKLLENYQPPKKAARHPREVTLEAVPLPRRLLLPIASRAPLDLSLSHAGRTFQAYHLLAKEHRIENRVAKPTESSPNSPAVESASSSKVNTQYEGTSQDTDFLPKWERIDIIHLLRCPDCNAQVRQCPANEGLNLNAAGSNWQQLCPDCRLAVRYCPQHSEAEIASQASLEVFTALKHQQNSEEITECQRCKNPHPASEGELCALCSYQEENPFSAAMPQAVLKTLPAELQEKLRGV